MREFKLPDPGEGLLEAEVVSWKVKVGDQVAVNDILLEIETAKSLVELPSPFAGVVTLSVAEGDEVDAGGEELGRYLRRDPIACGGILAIDDDRVEIELAPTGVTVTHHRGFPIVTAREPLPPLTDDEVRATVDSVRR